MMITCTIYDQATGAYCQYIKAPDIQNVLLNLGPGQVMVAGMQPEESYLRNGAVQMMPPRPAGRHWTFDHEAEAWIDPRTPADHQAALAAARRGAQRDKTGLLMELAQMGILTVPEAIQAAQGQIPASFEDALAALPEEAQGLARIKWAGDQVISRMNPLILLAAYTLGITDEQLDAAFGVQITQ